MKPVPLGPSSVYAALDLSSPEPWQAASPRPLPGSAERPPRGRATQTPERVVTAGHMPHATARANDLERAAGHRTPSFERGLSHAFLHPPGISPWSHPWRIANLTIWARLLMPSLPQARAFWVSTVFGVDPR